MSSTRNEVSVNVSRVIVGKATESDPCRVGCVENPNARILRVVHISDTRSNSESLNIPAGDILVHSGNFFNHDSCKEFCGSLAELDQFFISQPHKYKIFVAGNHEMCFNGEATDRIRAHLKHAIYLQDQSVVVEGLHIYGSPWSGKRRSAARAFAMPFPELGKYWLLIPNDTDLLITHSPPHRVLDDSGTMGCPLLRELVVKQIRPLVHLFGHTRQSAEVTSKHGVLFCNGSQFSGRDISRPNVVDIYVRPELAAKNKIYKLPVWKEAELNANSTSSDAHQQATTSSKPSCSLQ